jgi:amino acid permease
VSSINLDQPNIAVTIGKLAYCGVAGLSFPEQSQACRVALDSLLDTICTFSFFQSYTLVPTEEILDIEFANSRKKATIFTLLISLASFGFAFSIPNLDVYLALVGGTGGIALCFVLPAVFVWKAGIPDPATKSTAFFIAILGVGCGTLQVFSVFLR